MTEAAGQELEVLMRFKRGDDTAEVIKGLIKQSGRVLDMRVVKSSESTPIVSSLIVTEQQFFVELAKKESMTLSGLVDTWEIGCSLSDKVARDKGQDPVLIDGKPAVDLVNILESFRTLENGAALPSGVGQFSWDIFCQLINEDLAQDGETLVMPWIEEIHGKLRSTVNQRVEAATAIKRLYEANRQHSSEIN